MTKLLFDYDYLLYAAGGVSETRSIVVTHKTSGDTWEFPNRTTFWGHHKHKAGGWLAEWNSTRKEENKRKPEDFDVVDKQEPEPLANAIHTLKQSILSVKELVGAKVHYGYSGKGKVFREDVSTIIKYKGNREGALRPLHLDDLKAYLLKNHACEIVTGIEADDAVSIDSYNAWKAEAKGAERLVVACNDKDYKQVPGHLLYDGKTEYTSYGEGYGWLDLDSKGKPDGRGRVWLYYQVLAGDGADNYFPNSASDMKWGEMAAYKALKDCKSDRDALTKLTECYMMLYPAPKTIVGWRGDEILIDWEYVLRENFTLARMLRWEDDFVDLGGVMHRLGVEGWNG